MPKEDQTMASVPALPTRSSLRPSKFLEPITTKTGLIEQPQLSPATAPHDVYLSSEEDASSSADDFSDFELDSDLESLPNSPDLKASHEDIARVVSVVFYGKPSVVELRPRSTSPSSSGSLSPGALPRSTTGPGPKSHRRSISSSSSLFGFGRPSSIMVSKGKPNFLNIDPFAASKFDSDKHEGRDRPNTPVTPNTLLRRRFTLSKKKSKPSVYEAASQSRDNLSVLSMPIEADETRSQGAPLFERPSTPLVPGKYQDMMKSARGNGRATPQSFFEQESPSHVVTGAKNLFKGGLSLGRRKTIKS